MLITAYCNRMTLAGLRPATIGCRRTCLRSFAKTLPDQNVKNAGRLEVEAYLARDLAPESRRAYRSHLRAFYRWAVDEGYLHDDPTVKLPTVRVPRAVPRPIDRTDLTRALDHATPRMRAWLLLMALGGLRCIEVAGLRPQDLMPSDTGTLLFLRECKGGGEAVMPAHPAILTALTSLPIRNGLWWECGRNHISYATATYLRSLGINRTAHQLRHFAGTSWYQASDHDLLLTARLLRHASVQTSQIYAELDPIRPAQVVKLVQMNDPLAS